MPTGETPFRLTYKSEAIIPAEVGLTSYRVDNHDERKNDEAMHLQLDLFDEVRATAKQRLAWYQNRMARHYNSLVRHKDFQVRDLILRKVMGTARDPTQGKLGPNWEGPYRVMSWQRKGTYHLETMDGRKLHHPWNVKHLQKYYQSMLWISFRCSFRFIHWNRIFRFRIGTELFLYTVSELLFFVLFIIYNFIYIYFLIYYCSKSI